MAQINNEKLEELLKSSLSNKSTLPTDELNINLKKALRLKAGNKTICLWYLPLIAAILLSICISSFVIIFISSIIINVFVLGSLSLSLLSISILTYAGVKKFELKEGAVIEL